MLFASCSEQKEEVVDISDIIPQSKRDYDKVDVPTAGVDSTSIIKSRFINHGIVLDSLSFSDKRLFPDRVGPIRSEKYILTTKDETLEYYSWNYVDSAKTMNAFYNWIDFFGVEQLGDEVNFQKKSMCMLVGDTSLIFVSGNVIKIDEWIDYHESIGYEDNWNYLVSQKLAARARWFTFEGGKKVRYKKPTL